MTCKGLTHAVTKLFNIGPLLIFVVACGYNCHAKCEMKVPPNCTRVKGKIDRQKSISRSNGPKSRGSRAGRARSSDSPSSLAVSSNLTALSHAFAIYDYDAANPDEISMREGDEISIIEPDGKLQLPICYM